MLLSPYISVSQPVCRGTVVCRELLLGVQPNILPCDFNSLLPTINHFCFKNEK